MNISFARWLLTWWRSVQIKSVQIQLRKKENVWDVQSQGVLVCVKRQTKTLLKPRFKINWPNIKVPVDKKGSAWPVKSWTHCQRLSRVRVFNSNYFLKFCIYLYFDCLWFLINLQSLEDTQVGYILQKYTLDKYTLETF